MTTIGELGLGADLRAEPWTYPGPPLPFSCLQIGDRLLPLPDHGALDLAGRHFVISYGSNASPDVLRRKFERGGVSTTVPHFLGHLDGMALGHSAHVSRPGYVPVTPFPAQSSIPVVVSALTPDQLRCLDRTERNYDRVAVPATRVRLSVPWQLPRQLHLYESTWGTILDGPGTPLPFGPQSAIFARLAQWHLLPPPLAITNGIRHITRILASRTDLREWIRDRLTHRSTRLSGQETAQ